MGRRPDEFQVHRLIGTFKNAHATAHAVFVNNVGLHFFGTSRFAHFDGIEDATIKAGLAALALLRVDNSPEAAGREQLMHSTALKHGINDHATVFAAIADSAFSLNNIQRNMDQTFFFGRVIQSQGLFFTEFFDITAFAGK